MNKTFHHIWTKAWVGVLALAMTSCSDFLVVEPLNDITLEKFWNEKNDVDNVVNGCYSSLQSQACISRMMCWGEFRSDNIQGGTNIDNNQDLSNILKENINASNGFTDWTCMYKVINDCNTVIHFAPTVAQRDPNYTQSELRATVAEMSALRDLCYFYLIRTFRNVPFSKEAFLDDTQKMDLPATPFNTVLDSLITDLESVKANAVRKYPQTNRYSQRGRITQDAIHAMLCEMYLWKQDYQNAVHYADLVIKSKTQDYQDKLDKLGGNAGEDDQMQDGYPLITDRNGSTYGNAFNQIFSEGNSMESIFELVYMDDNNQLANGAVSSNYGNSETFPGLVKPSDYLGDDFTKDNPSVFLTKYDTRYYTSLEALNETSYGIGKYTQSSGFVTVTPPTSATAKGKATYGTHWPANYCHANWIIYRLTDIMLMKAEALVQMVNNDDETEAGKALNDSLLHEAYNIVNIINKRYNCSTTKADINYASYASKSLMTDLVMDERHRELLFEGKRWYDL
ncbi:MAG TPA: RagB/SusD family nutrient uptake outer membrane protein, partial [Prevotella sp.]|nr:RagB/SusD family nutrient uptake outer membrane protein [Prevotella sp.]